MFDTHTCTQEDNREQKLSTIGTSLVDNVEERCKCGFSTTNIISPSFCCFEDAATYRAQIDGTPLASPDLIASYVEEWLSQSVLISFGIFQISLDKPCQVVVTSLAECNTPTSVPTEFTTSSTTGLITSPTTKLTNSSTTNAINSPTTGLVTSSTTNLNQCITSSMERSTAGTVGVIVILVILLLIAIVVIIILAHKLRKTRLSIAIDNRYACIYTIL